MVAKLAPTLVRVRASKLVFVGLIHLPPPSLEAGPSGRETISIGVFGAPWSEAPCLDHLMKIVSGLPSILSCHSTLPVFARISARKLLTSLISSGVADPLVTTARTILAVSPTRSSDA
jgi:hypothetical protein